MNCQGDCCVAFRVPYTMEELEAGDVGDQDQAEAFVLAEMLEPLTLQEFMDRQDEFVLGARTRVTEEDDGHLYKCKKWDEETRLCTDYENRPPMCRTFPYDKPCRYGCSCTGDPVGPEVIV